MALRIEDYALIGDCGTAALVGRDGSIDWLCLPRFDSGACFAALLGSPQHGRWLIAPTEPVRHVTRAYRDPTLVLDTTFETASGCVTLTDCMPVRSGRPDVVRLVRAVRGRVRMRMELVVRFDYGSVTPWVQREADGLSAVGGPDAVRLHTPVTLLGKDWITTAEFDMVEGDELLSASDPRIVGTIAAIERQLVRGGFVDRYRTEGGADGLPACEGAFLLCTFWLADNYALAGRTADARRTFEALLAIRNDVGLLAEEYDPVARRQLGNFAQAFSHLGLINTARNLTQREKPAAVRAEA